MTYRTLRVEKTDSITTVFLNRPSQRNALNSEMIDELRAVIDELRGDESTRALIVTGTGKVFS
ncbi:MAG: enoyl-CoA hydratase/isomerase family protein, partial [Anaerolineae bacterium]|nr:enoyl-CoA hydratase/isomerase family protein [Anaerolineae bacterium]